MIVPDSHDEPTQENFDLVHLGRHKVWVVRLCSTRDHDEQRKAASLAVCRSGLIQLSGFAVWPFAEKIDTLLFSHPEPLRYTVAVDLYSYGVMLYMLVSGGETSLRNPAYMPELQDSRFKSEDCLFREYIKRALSDALPPIPRHMLL